MKKILVASSALVAVAFAGQAQASEKISLSLGGFMEQWVGVADEDNNAEGKNKFQSDTEVHFKGATTLDNGIEVGVAIEFGIEGGDNATDEQYLFVNGGFGQVKLGSEDGAAGDMTISAPAVGPVGANDGDLTKWISTSNVPNNSWDDGDDQKITYYTPVFGGFRAGVSYTDSADAEANDQTTNGREVVSGGVEYNGDFDAVSVSVAATGESKNEGEWYNIGANVGFANFVVGASYGEKDKEFGTTTGTYDVDGFDVGVSYAMDAATVSATYAFSDYGNGEVAAADLGLAYTLGAGVTWKSSIFWFEDDADNNTNDNDGFGAVTGLALSF
ncbi:MULTISPECIES: porin [Thalassospira]|uniref:Porin n=1 Tax=Thalassospira povalilytica TaxID=732237 RepID=A0A8I1M5F1_9PROT|nr:porin [Thalassospira povalilytica]MBN8195284.1 porin [Thalassospira povalilytica]PKR49951.1 porin [Thalassospira povalilytica]